jgi:hypothetical protein
MQYDDDRLYCTSCEKQPDHFFEMMAEHVNRVTPEGALFDPYFEPTYVMGYQCPVCGNEADRGHVLRDRAAQGAR